MKCIYVAGKLTDAHPIGYLRNLLKIGKMCIRLIFSGYAPFPTGLDLLWFLMLRANEDISEAQIKGASLAWVEKSDAVLVLNNWRDSSGTKAEIARALECGITVYYDIEKLRAEVPA